MWRVMGPCEINSKDPDSSSSFRDSVLGPWELASKAQFGDHEIPGRNFYVALISCNAIPTHYITYTTVVTLGAWVLS